MNDKSNIGTTEVNNNQATLRFTRTLAHPADVIWQALTDQAKFSVWFNAEAKFDARENGSIDVLSGPFHWTGAITTWQPTKVFEYEYNMAPSDEVPTGATTMMRWELTPAGDDTTLTFTHSGLGSTYGFAPGAHVVLDRLAAYLDGKELPDFMKYYEEIEPLYTVWNAEETK